jgi:hypothetical protein
LSQNVVLQELQHLWSSPVVSSNPAAAAEIAREMEAALLLLSQSVGVRTAAVAPSSSSGGGALDMQSHHQMQHDVPFSLDGAHVGAILQMAKGKQLMSRSLKLLNQNHRYVRHLLVRQCWVLMGN